jgi:hypothetical protein
MAIAAKPFCFALAALPASDELVVVLEDTMRSYFTHTSATAHACREAAACLQIPMEISWNEFLNVCHRSCLCVCLFVVLHL